jgi:hypothetical protein
LATKQLRPDIYSSAISLTINSQKREDRKPGIEVKKEQSYNRGLPAESLYFGKQAIT